MTPLAAARIAGEVGLAGGTITSSAYAVKYGGEVKSANYKEDQATMIKHLAENQIWNKNSNIQTYIDYVNSEWSDLTKCASSKTQDDSKCKQLIETLGTNLQRNLKGNN